MIGKTYVNAIKIYIVDLIKILFVKIFAKMLIKI